MGMPKGYAAKHGHSPNGCPSPTYRSWGNMIQRCTNPSRTSFPSYGGRGITFDPSWAKFAVFLADMGERPKGQTLDRIDLDKNYTKDNCKWSTRAEQDANKRQTVRWQMPDGRIVIEAVMLKELNLDRKTVWRWKKSYRVIKREFDNVWLLPTT